MRLFQRRAETPGRRFSAGEQVGIADAHDWSQRLQTDNALIVGSVERIPEYAATRTLVISWPEPGSDFPVRALRAYRIADGSRGQVVIKFGGYVGRHDSTDPGHVPPPNPGANIADLFRELAAWWDPDPLKPRFDSAFWENNMFVFRARTAERLTGIPDAPPSRHQHKKKDRKKKKR